MYNYHINSGKNGGIDMAYCPNCGSLLDVGIGMPHPVWRYARAMFMGVTI